MIGQPLDFQLRTEAWNAYTCADPEETKALLGRFYEKTDAGRAGDARDGAVRSGARHRRRRRDRRGDRRRGFERDGLDVVDPRPRAGLRSHAWTSPPTRCPDLERDRRLRLQRGDHRHDRPGPPDDPRAVGRRHRRQPDGRLPGRPGLPAGDAGARAGGGSSSSPAARRASGLPGQVAYSASKAGLIGMVKTLAAENARRGDHRQRGAPRDGRDRAGRRRCPPRSSTG